MSELTEVYESIEVDLLDILTDVYYRDISADEGLKAIYSLLKDEEWRQARFEEYRQMCAEIVENSKIKGEQE